jgi:hypothetical protein
VEEDVVELLDEEKEENLENPEDLEDIEDIKLRKIFDFTK